MSNVLEYIIAAKDHTKSAVSSALGGLKSLAAGIGKNLANIQAGFQMLGSVCSNFLGKMKKAFAFETMTIQFKTLIGNMDQAKEHMKMLQDMGDTPPFSLEEFAKASRTLMVMSDGALGFKRSLELVGDAAAATGQPIESLAQEVGRAYAIIRDGQPLTRATMSLRNMGVLTPEVAQKLQDLQDAGASTTVIWGEVENALKRYSGAMVETEQTGEGLMGAIGAQWDDVLREFGAACLDATKDGLGAVLDGLKGLREDGSIEAWATAFGENLTKVVKMCKDAVEAIKDVGAAVKWIYEKTGISDLWHGTMSAVAGVSAAAGSLAGGGGLGDAVNAYSEASTKELVKGHYASKLAKAGWIGGAYGANIAKEQEAEEIASAKRVEDARAKAQEKHRQDREQADKRKIEQEKAEQQKIQKSLEEGQRKINKRIADEKAKAEKELLEKELAAKLEAERKVAEERERAEAEANQDVATDDVIIGSNPQTADRVEMPPMHGGGGGGGGGIGGYMPQSGSSYQDAYTMMQKYAKYVSALREQKNMYWQSQFGHYQEYAKHYNESQYHPFGIDVGNSDSYKDQFWSMSQAQKAADNKFDALIENARDRMEQYKEQVANSIPSAPQLNAAERTATACEGILAHFDNGRNN